MKYPYILTLFFLFKLGYIHSQETTNSAGDTYNTSNNSFTFTIGESINDQYSISSFSLKAGVIQSASTSALACPIPTVYSFLPVNDLCVQSGVSKAIVLSNSEISVRYQLLFNGVSVGDSLIGTGSPLTITNATEPGVYSVRARFSGRSCYVDMPQQITLNSMPSVTANVSGPLCVGGNTSIQLSANEPVNLIYNISGGPTRSIEVNGSVSLPIENVQSNAGINVLSVTSMTTSCVNDVPQLVRVPVSNIPSITFNQTVVPCEGQPVSLSYLASEPLSFTYSLNGDVKTTTLTSTSGNLIFNSLSNASTLAVSGIISLQSNCQSSIVSSIPINVTAKPSLSALNLDICSKDPFSLPLSSSSSVSVNWTATYSGLTGGQGAGQSTLSLNEILTNNSVSPLTATYVLTPFVTNNSSCLGSPVISTVTVNPAPEIIIPSVNTTFCSGELISVPVLANGNGTLVWNRDNGASIGKGVILETIENKSSQSRIVNYSLTVEGGSCKNVQGKTLALTILPSPVLNINGIPALCDAFTDISANSITAGSTPNLVLSYFQDPQLSLPLANPSKVSQGTYFIKGQIGSCFVSAPISIKSQLKLKVNDLETACPGQKIDLTQAAVTEGSSAGLNLSYWGNAAATQPLSLPNAVDEGTYYIKAEALTSAGNCAVVKAVIAKTFNPVLLNPPENLSHCSGSVFTYIPQLNDATFSWFRNANGALGLTNSSGSNQINEILNIKSQDASVTLTYGYSIAAPGCSPKVSTFDVLITNGPAFTLVDSVQICDSYTDLTKLVKSTSGNLSFNYFLNDSPVSDVTKGIQGVYRVEGVSAGGCKTSKSIEVKHKLTVPVLSPFNICPPQTFDLKSKATDLFAASYNVSFEDISLPEKISEGNYAIGLSELVGNCKIILPVSVVSAQPKWLNPIASAIVCSGEKLILEPLFASSNVTYSWTYANGKSTGKLEAVWTNSTSGSIIDSIKLEAISASCNQSALSFVKVEVLPEPPSLQLNVNEVCADKLLTIGVVGIPANPLARFKWSADYGLANGGIGGKELTLFGATAIQETLFHEEDSIVKVKYYLQPFLSGTKACFSSVDSIKVSILPLGFGACSANIAGIIQTINKQYIEGVKVQISGYQGDRTVLTRKDGLYKMSGLALGLDYTVYPELNKFPLNGVSTYDILLIQKHLLNIRKITNPYELIAADVNKSGTITISDVLQLRKLILGINHEFSQNKSWRFVEASYKFQDVSQPYNFPELRNINDLSESAEVHFIGIKTGDLNGSVVANSNSQGDTRESNYYTFKAENKKVIAGDLVTLKLNSDEKLVAEGLQFTLQYDKHKLSFVSSMLDSFLLQSLGVFEDEGLITLSWANPVNLNEMFLSLPFKGLKAGELSDMISVSDRITRREAYVDGKILPMSISFQAKEETSSVLYNPYPNPFIEQVTIPYYLNANHIVSLKIMDISGRVVKTMTQEGHLGRNHFIVTNLPAGSEWTFEISTDNWKSMGKLISVY